MIDAIIVNYKAAALCQRALASLRGQAGTDAELAVWLVDNSADPAEAALLRETLGDACTLWVNPDNRGFGHACNQVYAQTQGEWVLLLNPDAYLEPGALAALLGFLQRHPREGAVGPLVYWDPAHRFMLPPSQPQTPRRQALAQPSGAWRGGLSWLHSLWQRRRALAYWRARRPLPQALLSGGHVLLRRAAVDAVGGLFDPRFFLYFEDTDLFLRLRQGGWGVHMLPTARAVHAFDSCGRAETPWKRQQMALAHAQFMQKHYPGQRPSAATGTAWQPHVQDLGVCAQAPRLPAPPHGEWLLEWGLNSLLLPAVGWFGQGAVAEFPAEAWAELPPATYYARLGAVNRLWLPPRVWRWQKIA